MTSVAARVVSRGTAVLLGSLLALGVATGTTLHLTATRALDSALLASAYGHVHPEVVDEYRVEHSRAPVEAWVVSRGDPRVPAEALTRALDREEPVYVNAGTGRLLLLPAERGEGPDEVHIVVAALAPQLGVAETVGPFAAAYSVFSLLVVVGAAAVLRATVRRAFVPLDRARKEAEAVLGLGHGQRLTTDAPEEVAALLGAVNGLLDRLDAAWAAQARFTQEAAHELRTPVAAMLGEIDVILRRDRDAPAYREALVSTREEVERLRRIVEALTALARLDAGEAERSRTITRARELVEAAVKAERLAPPPTVTVTDDRELRANVPLLELAIGNLLRNTARHAPGAAVEVRVSTQGERAVVEVHDAGPGVAEAEREAVFARFGRGSEARRRDHDGLGLGLAFAREVARRHGGDVTLGTSPLGGACVRMTLAGAGRA